MRYFRIMTGLRGCYMPDQNYVVACDTRRELKAVIASEMDVQGAGESPIVGLSKKNLAWAANHAWQGYKAKPDHGAIIPWGYRGQIAGRPYSIEIAPATRADYKEHCESIE